MAFSLSARLHTVAELVPVCNSLADIGTDHGFLPLYLLMHNRIRKAICSDVNAGPLAFARDHFQTELPSADVDFRLGNGLEVLHDNEADCCVIAGMGGDLIAEILQHAPAGVKTYVLQPMSKAEHLRYYLAQAGWPVVNSRLTEDGGYIYEVIVTSGPEGTKKSNCVPTDKALYFAANPTRELMPLYGSYINTKEQKLRKVIAGLQQSRHPDSDKLNFYQRALDAVLDKKQQYFRML